jgi:peptide/nickel transport system permease protein
VITYIGRRLLLLIPTLALISICAFLIMQAPPGDFMTSYLAQLSSSGESVDSATIESLRARYGLDQPIYFQYWKWISGFVVGDFGFSFEWNKPVAELLGHRLGLSLAVAISALTFSWLIALAIGVYSAVHKYSVLDYVFTFIGFIGLATPNFMLALVLMYLSFAWFGASVGGLFSPEYVDAPWSWGRFLDLLQHLWIPVIVVGTAGTASLIRIMRANLLDELNQPYMETAIAKGLSFRRALFRYPFRIAINPFLSTVGWLLPTLIAGEIITAIVLDLPTIGPLFLRALQNQDMYLAGSILMIISLLTVLGTLLSDLLLAWVDPRVRYQ